MFTRLTHTHVVSIIVFLTVESLFVNAQTKISGNVKDAKGQVIPGANIFLHRW